MSDLTKKRVARIEADRGPRIVYVGQSVNGVGDRSSPISYNLYCGCGVLLSCLGVLRIREDGNRHCYCPKCKHAVIMSQAGQVVHYGPYDITQPTSPRSS